jgi:SAM-dependent methyltransferase
VQSHFDQGYKDEDYFFNARAKIFTQLTGLLSEVTRKSGKVLDIGGAKGHLLNALHSDRSDLDLTLSDISAVACEFAKKHFSIRAIHGGIEALKGEGPFDAIVLSDVIYYEYDLAALWRLLSKISAENGAIVIRVPNKILLIRIIQKLKELMKPKFKREQYKISFFNPEHLYLLTDKYLKKSLRDAGFGSITVIPAEPLRPQGFALGAAFMSFLFRAIWVISGGWLVLSPSKIYVAKRPVR